MILNERLVIVVLAALLNGVLGGIFDWKLMANPPEESAYKIVCYYTNWAQYRPKPGAYYPSDIDANLCTHVIIAFAKINAVHELEAFEWNDESTEWSEGTYEKIVNLKKQNNNLKVLVAVGGWNHGSRPFSDMVSDDAKRANFVNKTVQFLIKHKFDGLDLDWEYPANRDTENRPDDKFYFTILCKELHTEFKPHDFILTAAVAAGIKYMNTAYEMTQIHKYLNFINVMAYDIHGAWENVTGHNSPLYAHPSDKDTTLNVDFAMNTWLEAVPANKLVLGLPTYGRSFRIKEGFESCPLTDTPVSQAGTSGTYSRENGFLTYYEICEKLLNENWKYIWNDKQQIPYAYSSEIASQGMPLEWVGFDDVRSIEIKVKYIKEKNLAGAMIWSLDMDDFTGTFCKQGKYPLLNTINYYLNKNGHFDLPKEHIIRKGNDSSSSSSKEEPMTESEFYQKFPKKLSTSFNVFNLIENDVIQIYRFCQCKNGTHKISSSQNSDDKSDDRYSYVVDCDRKQVHTTDELKKINRNRNEQDETNKKKTNDNDNVQNVWTVFGSSASSQLVPHSYICMLNIFLIFYNFF